MSSPHRKMAPGPVVALEFIHGEKAVADAPADGLGTVAHAEALVGLAEGAAH